MSARAVTFVGWNVENLAPHLDLLAAGGGRAARAVRLVLELGYGPASTVSQTPGTAQVHTTSSVP